MVDQKPSKYWSVLWWSLLASPVNKITLIDKTSLGNRSLLKEKRKKETEEENNHSYTQPYEFGSLGPAFVF